MMNWNGRKVLLTGAGGFIGSHLCEALVARGADVTALIHYNSRNDWGNLEMVDPACKAAIRVAAGNIEDSDFVARQVRGQAVVFHLAALIAIPYSYAAPLSYVRANVEGTLNVLEAAREYGVERVVHTSTSETYGTAIYAPIDEKHPLQGQSPYSASKIAADKIAESYYLSFNTPVVTLRPFNTYGPRQSARAVIPTIITQALTQEVIRLGSLDPVRDMNYVKDTVNAFIRAAEAPEQALGQVINAGSGRGVTIGELVDIIQRLLGTQKAVVQEDQRLRPAKSEVFRLICDNRKAAAVMDWTPQYTLEDGLAETIAYLRSHLHLYKTNQYTI
ncbi:MAG TPA: GDP-mannose 4,6-dehydratase [Anaerolineaceae bacterium]|jgi:NAD dependent epimerase/dehydratase|nr:GDP-mannose 4,6-dehydratase [Anaerolineaceae bacterium]